MNLETRFETILNHVNEGILIADKQGTIILTNPRCTSLFGYDEGELIGQSVDTLVPSEHADRHVEHRETYMKHPVKRPMGKNMTLFGQRKNGEKIPIEISLSYYETDEGLYVIAFIIDIAERFEQQEKIKKMNSQLLALNESLEKKVTERTMVLKEALTGLEQSRDELSKALEKEKELNELKSRFITMASHEFRTPLSTILSSVSLIGKYPLTEDEEKRQKHIGRIKNAVDGLTEILNDFLSLGKLEEGRITAKLEPMEMTEAIKEIASEMQLLAKEGQQILLDAPEKVMMKCDKQVLRNILYNILSNAIKFSPPNKPIEISLSGLPGELIITVKDHGIGIPEEDQKHLFQRFFRARNVQNIQGTGLGLNIVTKYMELLKGYITCQSKVETGTTFQLHFNITE